jgi:hypothetical protein
MEQTDYRGAGRSAPAGTLALEIGDLATQARQESVRLAADAREQMRALVRRRKDGLAARLANLASALRAAGRRLESDAPGRPAPADPRTTPAAAAVARSRQAALDAGAEPALDVGTRGLVELAGRAAQEIDRASRYLHDHEVKDLVRDAEVLARRRPAVFVGGTLAAGFLLARFLRSSGERAWQSESPGRSPLPPRAGAGGDGASRAAAGRRL